MASASRDRQTVGRCSMTTAYHAKLWAETLALEPPEDELAGVVRSLGDARVDLQPHQVEAALFAMRSPYTKGVLLADEVGLGSSGIEGIYICAYVGGAGCVREGEVAPCGCGALLRGCSRPCAPGRRRRRRWTPCLANSSGRGTPAPSIAFVRPGDVVVPRPSAPGLGRPAPRCRLYGATRTQPFSRSRWRGADRRHVGALRTSSTWACGR